MNEREKVDIKNVEYITDLIKVRIHEGVRVKKGEG